MPESFRIEHDTMGEMRVPVEALYGAETQRAVENFPISGMRFGRAFLNALGLVKYAAAQANRRTGALPRRSPAVIEQTAARSDGRPPRFPIRRGRIPDRQWNLHQHERQ